MAALQQHPSLPFLAPNHSAHGTPPSNPRKQQQSQSWTAKYKLTVSTKASGHTLTGGAKPVSDTITQSNDGNASETMNGTITLNVNTGSSTVKKTKKFTAKTDGDTQVSFTPQDAHGRAS